jgi:hypothetical protein
MYLFRRAIYYFVPLILTTSLFLKELYWVSLILSTSSFFSLVFENMDSCRCTYLVQKDHLYQKKQLACVALKIALWMAGLGFWSGGASSKLVSSRCMAACDPVPRRQRRWCSPVCAPPRGSVDGGISPNEWRAPQSGACGLRCNRSARTMEALSLLMSSLRSRRSRRGIFLTFPVAGQMMQEQLPACRQDMRRIWCFRLAQGHWNLSLSLAGTNGPTSIARAR